MAHRALHICAVFILIFSLKCALSQDVIVELNRSIQKEGFHRDVQTTVSISPDDLKPISDTPCSVLLIETLPSGLYVDTFQLDSLVEFGGPKVLTDEHIDIEAPEYLSKQHELYVYAELPPYRGQLRDPVTVSLSLPVHVRYHRRSPNPEVTHVLATLYHPRVLLNCTRKRSRTTSAPCDVQNTSLCPWSEVIYKSETFSLKFSVPVGPEKDLRVVMFATIVVTVLGCTFLLYIIAFYDSWKVKLKSR